MAKELVVVLDFGGQYNQLIARRIRDLGVYAEVHPSSMGLDQLKALNPKGIIFTGGPQSVYKEESQHIDPAIFSMGIPILGICYGAQLIAYELGTGFRVWTHEGARRSSGFRTAGHLR